MPFSNVTSALKILKVEAEMNLHPEHARSCQRCCPIAWSHGHVGKRFPSGRRAIVLIDIATGGARVTADLRFSREQTVLDTSGHPCQRPSGPRLRSETISHSGFVTSRLFERHLGSERTLGDQATSARFIAILQRTAGNRAVQSLLSRPEHTALQRCGAEPCACAREGSESREDASSSAATAGAGMLGTLLTSGSTGSAPAELTSLQRTTCKKVSGTAKLPHGQVLPAKFQTEKATALMAMWDMSAKFESVPPDPGICGQCGEYRQYVMGKMVRNGAAIPKPLADDNFLTEGQFHEDAGKDGSEVVKYGYHSMRFQQSQFKRPDQATGQEWEGWDKPQIGGNAGDHLKLDLGFKGELVDTCNDDKKLTPPATWIVAGSGVVPTT